MRGSDPESEDDETGAIQKSFLYSFWRLYLRGSPLCSKGSRKMTFSLYIIECTVILTTCKRGDELSSC